MTTKISKKAVMLKAWEIVKMLKVTLSEALKKACKFMKDTLHKLLSVEVSIEVVSKLLKSGKVTFGYIKKDGSYRVFNATKNLGLIPEIHHPYSGISFGKNLKFYDFDSEAWRSVSTDTKILYMIV